MEGFYSKPKVEWNPNQLEFKFFWPLTEQIPLELNYEGCEIKNQYVYSSSIGLQVSTGLTFVDSAPTWTPSLHIDSETITFNNLKMPWYRKALFKLIGFKWKK
jgi:hypothetical protein